MLAIELARMEAQLAELRRLRALLVRQLRQASSAAGTAVEEAERAQERVARLEGELARQAAAHQEEAAGSKLTLEAARSRVRYLEARLVEAQKVAGRLR